MSARDPHLNAAISELANALQVAAPVATQLRQALADQADDARILEAAIDRAVRAARQLQLGDGGSGGGR